MLKTSPNTIVYKFPITKKVIEVPKNCVKKTHVLACASVAEAAGGLGFLAVGIAQKDPIFLGTALAIFGKIAGQITMMKGSLWDFAGKFHQKDIAKILDRISMLKKTNPNLKKDPQLMKELEMLEERFKKM